MISLLEDLPISKQIRIASDFYTAQEQLLVHTPDIVLLDINMPGKNGIELLRFIRVKNFGSEVIMLTNHAEVIYREQCQELGARFFLDKSSDFGLVPDIIKDYYSHHFDNQQPDEVCGY